MKKLLAIIMAILSTFCIFSLCACDKDKPFAPHEHTYTETVVNPTCTESGYTLHKCSCGNEYTDNKTEALGHNFVDGICSVCGLEEETHTDPIEEHTHEYVETVFEPTCTEKGYTLYVCACGYEYSDDETEALGHTLSEAVEENRIEPTCTEEGAYESVVYCAICNVELSRETIIIDKLEHDYVCNHMIEPTCTSIGYDVYVCKVCKNDYQQEVEKLPHNYIVDNNNVVKIDNTFMQIIAKCSVCDKELECLVNYTETIQPTCISDGYDIFIDDGNCIEYHTNNVPATHLHLVGYLEDNTPVKLQAYGTNEYIIDEEIQYFIDNGTIRFNAGVAPTQPNERKIAIFDCEHCGRMIVCLLKLPEIN